MACSKPLLTATNAASRRIGGKTIHVRRIENRHIRHADACHLGLAAHGFHQPGLGGVGGGCNHPGTGKPFGGPLGQGQGNKRTAEPEHGRECQQRIDIQTRTLFVKDAIHA